MTPLHRASRVPIRSTLRLAAALAALTLLSGACEFITNVSHSPSGTIGDGTGVSLNKDGRVVAFAAKSAQGSDLAAPQEGGREIFVKDVSTGTMTGISQPISGPPQGNSSEPHVSADGRFVSFTSIDSNLVPNETSEIDVFVRAVSGGPIIRVSQNAAGEGGDNTSAESSIDGDGNLVVFNSKATNLVPNDDNGLEDVFLANVKANTITRVTTGGGIDPSISADGKFVAFTSEDTTLVPDDVNGTDDVFVKELATGKVQRASVTSLGVESNGTSGKPSISSDGRYVAYVSEGTNLVTSDTDPTADVYRFDRQTGGTVWVSVATDGGSPRADDGTVTDAERPQISGSGRQVVFESEARNLASLVNANTLGHFTSEAFVRDVDSGRTNAVSADNSGVLWANGNGVFLLADSISGDGRYVGFISDATNLIDGEAADNIMDIYERYSTRAAIDTVTPSTIARGTTTTIFLNGAGYLSGATVTVSNSTSGGNPTVTPLTVTGPNSAQFTITIPAGASPEKHDISVTNIGTGPGAGANSVSDCISCLTVT